MILFKVYRQLSVGFMVTLSAVGPCAISSEVKAQWQLADISQLTEISFNLPPVADNGAPGGRRKGAGSHSSCQVSQPAEISPLIALMPEVSLTPEANKTYVWGKTTLARPTFWYYIAYPANTTIEFILQDEAENEIYQTTLSMSDRPGIIGLMLPEEIMLETEKSYHWYLNVMCSADETTDDFVEGWIEKVELNPVIKRELETVQPVEQVRIYAKNGLWYDTLTSLDRLRQSDPENQALAAIWSDLLQQVNLSDISQESVVRRYRLEK